MANSFVLGTSFLPLFEYSSQKKYKPCSFQGHTIKKVIALAGGGGDDEKTMVMKEQRYNYYERNEDQCLRRSSLKFSGEKPSTPILDTINHPLHINNLSIPELEGLADELREEIVYMVSKSGGHLSSSLGVADLTVALHHVFNTPQDKIIWDVGHQAYGHKILTGRRSKMHTIRQTGGLAGFPKRDESVHDAFGVGHSSTSISAALGMAVARDIIGKDNHIVSVIGDGAMTAGQAYEAMNNAGYLDTNLIIILNDNKQVSLPTASPVGALSRALSNLQTNTNFHHFRQAAKGVTKQIGSQAHEFAAKLDSYVRGMVGGSGASFFEELGLFYIGPVDGHCVEDLVHILKNVKAMPTLGPVLIHAITEKGKGYLPAENAPDKMHGGLVGYGTMVQNCMAAANVLEAHGISTTVVDARFCKPLDGDLMRQLAREHEILITVEEGSIGGFGSHVSHFLALNGLLDGNLKWRAMTLPDRYIEHGSQRDQIEVAGLDSKHIAATALSLTNVKLDNRLLLSLQI